MATNCWEDKKCGRQPGGSRAAEMGVCPAASRSDLSGTNRGRAAGRICWYVAGTFCGGKVQGTHAEKSLTCMTCDHFKRVRTEEGVAFRMRPASGG